MNVQRQVVKITSSSMQQNQPFHSHHYNHQKRSTELISYWCLYSKKLQFEGENDVYKGYLLRFHETCSFTDNE